jgi:myo-inositol-1(or 4)-monophosphatase
LQAAEAEIDHAAIVAELSEAVREAGALALGKFRSPFKSWTKGASSPVSEVDIAVDEMLRERLSRVHPGYGWLSEESVDDPSRLRARSVWIVDPIDGTRAFIAGLNDWAISAALAHDGQPVAAALFAPVENALFLATVGTGATLNGVRLAASDGADLTAARVAGPKRRLDALEAAEPGIEPLPKVNSLALRIARVAAGTIDIAFAGGNSHDWDLAAADLVLREAGGALTSFDGRNVVYNLPNPAHPALVAAGSSRHALLLRLMQERPNAFA